MEKGLYYKNKYYISSNRWQGYDYSKDGIYFITICTKNHVPFFGKIICDKMELSEIGIVVEEEIIKTKEIRKNLTIIDWVIMPNHIHLLLNIDSVETHYNASENMAKRNPVETHCNASLQQEYKNTFGPQVNNISSIIRGFKGAVKKKVSILGYNHFAWQPRFYDRVIRNEDELGQARKYIIENPVKWAIDKEYVM